MLNDEDRYGHLPEFEPFTLYTDQYRPLDKLQFEGRSAKATLLVSDELISDTEEYQGLATQNQTIVLEIIDGDNKQVLRITDFAPLEVKQNAFGSSKKGKKAIDKCFDYHGQYIEDGHKCNKYYWVHEMCIAVAKYPGSGKWYLDRNRFDQGSYGCAYRPLHRPSKMMHYEWSINNVQVWQQLYIERARPLTMLFPLKYPSIKFTVRHGGDPLLASLNISPIPGKLEFGRPAKEKSIMGFIATGLSLVVLIGILSYFRSAGCMDEGEDSVAAM